MDELEKNEAPDLESDADDATDEVTELPPPEVKPVEVEVKPEELEIIADELSDTDPHAPVQDPETGLMIRNPSQDPWSPTIPVVELDDRDGFANMAVRLLGQGDGGHYNEVCAGEVTRRQEEAGIEPDGVISGQTWALVLPEVTSAQSGEIVSFLRKICGLSPHGVWDGVLAAHLSEALEVDTAEEITRINQGDWFHLLVLAEDAEAQSSLGKD